MLKFLLLIDVFIWFTSPFIERSSSKNTFSHTLSLHLNTEKHCTRMNEVTCNSMPYNTLSASATTNNNNNINFYNSQWYLQRLMHALKKSKFPLYFKFRGVVREFQIIFNDYFMINRRDFLVKSYFVAIMRSEIVVFFMPL